MQFVKTLALRLWVFSLKASITPRSLFVPHSILWVAGTCWKSVRVFSLWLPHSSHVLRKLYEFLEKALISRVARFNVMNIDLCLFGFHWLVHYEQPPSLGRNSRSLTVTFVFIPFWNSKDSSCWRDLFIYFRNMLWRKLWLFIYIVLDASGFGWSLHSIEVSVSGMCFFFCENLTSE